MNPAFNGQRSKLEIFNELCAVLPFDLFMETGTYQGDTTAYLASKDKPVYSVDLNPAIYQAAYQRLRYIPHVILTCEDSRNFLERILQSLNADDLAFIYLDAHFGRGHDLPLREEVRIIARQHPQAVVMIDDFKIEDDPGYYLIYDFGICADFFKEETAYDGWDIFVPSLPSKLDTCAKQIGLPGTAVMVCEPELAEKLKELPSLRQIQ